MAARNAFGLSPSAAIIGGLPRPKRPSGMPLREWLCLPEHAPMPDEATVWRSAERRRIDACLCVTFMGQHWHVSAPGYRVGDVVLCLPTRRGVVLRVRSLDTGAPDTLAVRADLAASLRSRPRTARPDRSATNSGSPTTAHAQSRADSPLDGGAHRQIPVQQAATPRGRRRSRKRGKARAALVAPAVSIRLVLDVRLSLASSTPGSST